MPIDFDKARQINMVLPRPELLLHRQIPKPLHGMAPRIILGQAWWDKERFAAFAKTGKKCAACGVHAAQQKGDGNYYLEGHEVYEINYRAGRMTYLEAVGLCNYCHNYIHKGRFEALRRQHKISLQTFAAIINYGDKVLKDAGLKPLPVYKGKCADWPAWRLVINGKEYGPAFKSEREWSSAYAQDTEDS